ncbi:MAG: hypothetical protein DRP49_06430 [Spirochaetes bacterium]|nr:MAG: hypothetical protein DRP49_06430 [Spirochaetota bacterium]
MRFFKLTSGKLSPGALLIVLLLSTPGILSARAAAAVSDTPLIVGAVQFAVSEEVYQSIETFRSALEESLDRLEAEAASTGTGRLNLAIFPEYTSAFLGLSFLSSEETASLAADTADNRSLVGWALRMAEPQIISIWAEIARERGYAILAGTALILDTDGNIRNRALLFSPEGEMIWTQDKVFPGAPEIELLNLKTGKISDVYSFEINGFKIVTTICRDTYHQEWEEALPEADLWIDIKANELPFTREYYDEALAARLPNSPIDTGFTVSLSGDILGFTFTGPTEFLKDDGGVTTITAATSPYEKNAVSVIRIR